MSDDDALGNALWLAAGGAAGYAAGRWLVAPALAKQPTSSTSTTPSSQAPRTPVVAKTTAPRALAASPSGPVPIDPYTETAATGLSGMMQPIDPYADPSPSDGPITNPSQVPSVAASSGPAASSVGGAITRPSQSVTAPVPASSGAFATSAHVRRFDEVFARYRGSIPLAYVRALVERESGGQPSVRAGSAIGLMQVMPVVLADYNKRHGSAYGSEHLADPATNVAVGCELLRIIVESYRKHHPRIRSLQPDWGNPEYVGLVTLGWNAGYSEAGGLGRVARYLEGLGAVDITIDQVSAHAKLAGATKHLTNPAKVAWCKSVVALYQRERTLQRSSPLA